MKKYYDQKVSEGPDLKEGDKVYLLTKNFESKRPSKKLNYVKMGTRKEFKTFYKKGTGVLSEITSGNIKKEKKSKKPDKGNK